ncbi:glycoside hydrolase family 97 protein, partial [Lutimonas sp.]|uniref:glycoside hydrolase family 97 protein n=1 Tax=Lutimonas sp. TaxID=1872403 RepID=UPI003C7888BE
MAQIDPVGSPDGRILLQVSTEDHISWTVSLDKRTVIEKVVISMTMDKERILGAKPVVRKVKVAAREELFEPQIPHRDARIESKFNEMILDFKGAYQLVFRVYNDGVAYRFNDLSKKTQEVYREELTLAFPQGSNTFFPKEESMYSHNERIYLQQPLAELQRNDFCSLPVMFENTGAKVLITEASLHDYPGMFLRYDGNSLLKADFPKYVLKAVDNEKNSPDRNQILEEEADYIAKVSGGRAYPWRVFMIGDDDKVFLESNLVTQLSEKSKIKDASWIKPGKVAWDWYNANNIYGVDFEAGLNTATYKYYIDFAADNGIEYVILDEGWTKSTTEILEANPDIDIKELIAYGKDKGVEIILWVLWKPLDENTNEILELYAAWGVKGIKVDFMQRNDQYMVSSYERIASTAAGLKLMVDYHGAFKPAGIEKVWPNVINYEGVKGNENNKWSADISPEHNVTIPFIRMAAGPMDFTPGAMDNAHAKNYAISFTRPMALGTRCHQLAMYVVYEAPLQMLCESPTRYKKEQESVDFMTSIPTTWDETKVLEAKVADYVLVARRHGKNWYLGGMTDDSPRDFELKLDFLSAGTYTMEIMKDGVNAEHH